MSDVRALEHSTLKVPYELLNKKFRFAQKTIDREVSRVGDIVGELEKVLKQPVVTVKDMDGIVINLLDKLTNLKRKAVDSVGEETAAATTLKKRLDHIKVAVDPDVSDVTLQQWRSVRADRYVVDYLLRTGCYDTAMKLAAYNDVEYLTNWPVFLKAKEVEESLAKGETAKWLEWCYDNRSKLRRTKSSLELKIRQQEFIELIRKGERMEAVKYARKHFSSQDAEQWSNELSLVMGLLAFDSGTQLPKYKELFSTDRWKQLVDEFREENFRLFQLNNQSVFSACLQSGMSAMKTPKCYSNFNEPIQFRDEGLQHVKADAKDCPVCTADVKALAQELPSANASQSRLICAYSGEPLNEHNPPLVLPNGRVYGQRSLLLIASDNDGKVICPRTKQIFSLKDAERVYVM